MTDTRYGLVLTGPKDGEFVSAPWEFLKAPIEQEVPAAYADFAFESMDEVLNAKVDIFVYRHTEMWFRNDDERTENKYGFWVPEGEKSPKEFVIRHLAQFYADHSGK